jgi:phage terminase large subunit GpA-like protein
MIGPLTTIRRAWADGIRPEVPMTVSEWADKYRRLPEKSSAEPGPWRTDRTPYLREIMDCMSTMSDVEEVVVMKAAQVGGSECILNALGYIVDHAPGPTIAVQPTVELAKRFSRQRLDPLMTDTPRLAEKVAPARSRDSGNTMLAKDFAGGQLILTGANSAVGLRSMPAQNALLDEIDGYPVDVDEEGSPIELVEARQRTFPRKKRIKVSTPTLAGKSAIEAAYEASDKRRFYVPCPACEEMQPLEFARLVWSSLGLPPAKAVYECRACGYHIQNHEKSTMLARGEWRAEATEPTDGKIRGYHLNGLYAPVGWMSWGDIAQKFTKSHRNPEKHRVFVNTVLGEVWTSKGEAPEWDLLMSRREPYMIGTVPMDALFLTAGVDVQKDRLVYEVVGWGREKRSWSIDYGEIPGDPGDLQRGPWGRLDALLDRMYPHDAGVEMPIRMLAIDTGGHWTQTVYAWCRKYPLARVIAVKGNEHGNALIGSPSPVEVLINGKKSKRGYRIWPVAGSIAKSELYGWLRLEPNDEGQEPPGFCHFPEYDDEYFKQLTSEQLVTVKTKRGYIRLEWNVIPGRQNHVLDCRVYARAAAALMGLDRLTGSDWNARERAVWGERRPDTPVAAIHHVAPTVPTQPPTPARKPSWLGSRQGNWLRGRN